MIGDFYEGSDLKLEISLSGMGFDQSTDDYLIDLYNNGDKLSFDQTDMREEEGHYYLPVPYDRIHSGSLFVVVTAIVTDADFPEGKRREVLRPVNIGPIRKISK